MQENFNSKKDSDMSLVIRNGASVRCKLPTIVLKDINSKAWKWWMNIAMNLFISDQVNRWGEEES